MRFFCLVVLSFSVVGCKVPQGTNVQTSGVGLHVQPFGASPAAPRLSLGSVAHSFSLPAPLDAGPTLNRVQISTAGIADHTATIAQGGVGRELDFAGDVLPDSLEALHSPMQAAWAPPSLSPSDAVVDSEATAKW